VESEKEKLKEEKMDVPKEIKEKQDITNESQCLENKNKLAEIYTRLGQINDS